MINGGVINGTPINAPHGEYVPFDDWAAAIDPTTSQIYYALEIDDGVLDGVRYSNGETQESELARAPLNDVRVDSGPTNVTMTISGYSQVPVPGTFLNRTLNNVRSESISGGFRVRSDLDFFLRPGHQATSRGTTFTVSYINYYVNASDEYMDVGERAL